MFVPTETVPSTRVFASPYIYGPPGLAGDPRIVRWQVSALLMCTGGNMALEISKRLTCV